MPLSRKGIQLAVAEAAGARTLVRKAPAADAGAGPAPSSPSPCRRGADGSARRSGPALGLGDRLALGAVGVVVVLAIVGPWLAPYVATVPSGEAFLPPLSDGHLLGTDAIGMDILSRVLVGMRSSLGAAVVVTLAAAAFGTVIGVLAGFRGGWLDSALMRVTDLFLAVPATIIAMVMAAALGQTLGSAIIGIAVVWWPLYARLVRGEVRRVVALPHVTAAQVSGVKGWRLLTRHVAPAVSPTVAVTASIDIGGVIMTLAALSFLGLGSPAPTPELGRMAADGMRYLLSSWWIPVMPSLAITVMAFVFNYAGDAWRTLLRGRGV
ncbi:ABC transporter permease [Demequina sp. NBRC 110057]|uniref:ABC transporter permease n=1 Tax=Demequina sp. NBRC 110057 TaxID=1570346 RepID=UPI000A05B590|nr:ABC transporter permease [Demequina sp. NBRC 110057]